MISIVNMLHLNHGCFVLFRNIINRCIFSVNCSLFAFISCNTKCFKISHSLQKHSFDLRSGHLMSQILILVPLLAVWLRWLQPGLTAVHVAQAWRPLWWLLLHGWVSTSCMKCEFYRREWWTNRPVLEELCYNHSAICFLSRTEELSSVLDELRAHCIWCLCTVLQDITTSKSACLKNCFIGLIIQLIVYLFICWFYI